MTAVSDAMRGTITAALDDIAATEGVRILLAIESGSRAWGFHSPDSDYDVRFIYTHGIDWHLSVEPGRDVIERPISGELDLSGWDLRKTLGLILRSNAVALEWLRSPITYTEAPEFRADLLAFARDALRRVPVTWHYRRLAERQVSRLTGPEGGARLKRYFYVIRPVLALRWLRLHGSSAAPPMDMATLVSECDLPDDVQVALDALTRAKMAAKEMGTTSQTPSVLDDLIATEMAHAATALEGAEPEPRQKMRPRADALLSHWVRRADAELAEFVQ